MNKKIFLLFFLVLFICPALSLAATLITNPPPATPQPTINRGLGDPTVVLARVITIILSIVWTIAGAIAIIMFAVAGLRFIIAQGNPQKIAEARQAVIWGAIGTIVVVLAWSALAITKATLGV